MTPAGATWCLVLSAENGVPQPAVRDVMRGVASDGDYTNCMLTGRWNTASQRHSMAAWHDLWPKSFSAFSITPPPYSLYFPHGPRADSRIGPAWGKTGTKAGDATAGAASQRAIFGRTQRRYSTFWALSILPIEGGWSGRRGSSQPGAAPFQRPPPTARTHSRHSRHSRPSSPNSGAASSRALSIARGTHGNTRSHAPLHGRYSVLVLLFALVARITLHHGRLLGGFAGSLVLVLVLVLVPTEYDIGQASSGSQPSPKPSSQHAHDLDRIMRITNNGELHPHQSVTPFHNFHDFHHFHDVDAANCKPSTRLRNDGELAARAVSPFRPYYLPRQRPTVGSASFDSL
ncbi:hypothetical protein TrVGV298_003947 [Trichoderma virens]|nr:hypothetical protein TrVGV298_003947 [Trichoderma virens]